MKNMARLFVLPFTIIIVIAMLFSIACAPSAEVAQVSTPEPTASESASPTASPTATPTAIPTPATDEYGFTEERKAELNQQFQNFLNKEGEFTPEKMSQIMMETPSRLDKSEVGLGIADTGDVPRMQGYFFDYLEKDGRIFLFVGFDGKDGNRFITPLEITIYYYESFEPSRFDISEYKENSIMAKSENITCEDYGGDKNKLVSLLNDVKGRVVLFSLTCQKWDISDYHSSFPNLDPKTQENVTNNLEENNSKVELSFGLYQLSPQNGIPPYTNPDKIKGDSESILKLTNPEEMGTINIDQVPIIQYFDYYSGEFSDAG